MPVDTDELRTLIGATGLARHANRVIDARAMEALGWIVRRGAEARHPNAYRCRGPAARTWQAVPELSRDPWAAFALLPHSWEYRVGRDPRHAPVIGWAMCSNCEPAALDANGTVPNPRRLAFEVRAYTPGLAALHITLRALLALHEAAGDAPMRSAA